MKLEVTVEGKKFKIGVGEGYNDIAWLAQAAVRQYSQQIYPRGNYKPSILKIGELPFIPHPRKKINEVVAQVQQTSGSIPMFYVSVQGKGQVGKQESHWQTQAFGTERNMQTFKFLWYTTISKEATGLDQLTKIEYFLVCDYKMDRDCKFEFAFNDYPASFQLELKLDYNQTDFEAGTLTYSGEKLIPFGEISAVHINKINHNLDEPLQNISKIPINSQTSTMFQTPTYTTMEDQIKKIKDDIRIHDE